MGLPAAFAFAGKRPPSPRPSVRPSLLSSRAAGGASPRLRSQPLKPPVRGRLAPCPSPIVPPALRLPRTAPAGSGTDRPPGGRRLLWPHPPVARACLPGALKWFSPGVYWGGGGGRGHHLYVSALDCLIVTFTWNFKKSAKPVLRCEVSNSEERAARRKDSTRSQCWDSSSWWSEVVKVAAQWYRCRCRAACSQV